MDLVQILPVLLSSCVTLGKLISLSVPGNALLENGVNSTYLTELN